MPDDLDELWVPEFTRVTLTAGPGQPYRFGDADTLGWLALQHTVEGDPRTTADTRSAFVRHPSAPQKWADHDGDDKVVYQGISLGRMGFSLERPSDRTETNAVFGVIQLELEGFAARTGLYTSVDIQGLAWIWAATWQRLIDGGYEPGPMVPYRDVGLGNENYGYAAAGKMSRVEWLTRTRADGVRFNFCGHGDGYRQAHWDAGKFPYRAIADLVNRQIGPAGPIPRPTGVATVERLEKVTGFPGQVKIEGASTKQRLYAYFTPEGAKQYEAKVVVYPKDGRFVRYVDVAGGALYRVDLDDGKVGVPGAPKTVRVEAAPSAPDTPAPAVPADPAAAAIAVLTEVRATIDRALQDLDA